MVRRSWDFRTLLGGSTDADSVWSAECPRGYSVSAVRTEKRDGEVVVVDLKCCPPSAGVVNPLKCEVVDLHRGAHNKDLACRSGDALVAIYANETLMRPEKIKCCGMMGSRMASLSQNLGQDANGVGSCYDVSVAAKSARGGPRKGTDLWNTECSEGEGFVALRLEDTVNDDAVLTGFTCCGTVKDDDAGQLLD